MITLLDYHPLLNIKELCKGRRWCTFIPDRIINQLILRGLVTIQVSEYKTSFGSRETHLRAATRIALMGGDRVYSIRELNPTEGDLKEIQRQSRIISSGGLTISTELARLVACGEITMEDAIKKA